MRRVYRPCGPAVKSVTASMLLVVLALWAPGAASQSLEGRLERSRSTEARLQALQGAFLEGRYQSVLLALDASRTEVQKHPRLLNLRGLTFAALGQHSEAVENFELGLRLDPRLAELHQNLAISLVALGASGRALSEFDQALELDPEALEARLGAGVLLLGLRRAGPAREHLEWAANLAANDLRVVAALARLADLEGDTEQARVHWGRLELEAPTADTARRLAELTRETDPDTALEWFDRCADRDSTRQDCALAAAVLRLGAGDALGARRSLEWAEARGGLDRAAEQNLFLALSRLGDVEAMRKRTAEEPPRTGAAWGIYAASLREAGSAAEALEAAETACERSPDDLDLRNLLAVILSESGQGDRARGLWRSILEADPTHPEARANLDPPRGR